ncbi:MAG: hypothetical protein HEQ20_14365 [Aphanizomenon flos-aquae KM1D3_PB]|nr:MAG: hypothetical protein HEQ20_14365 [Aphanizomenon flos-aquae KM1D3_PB]
MSKYLVSYLFFPNIMDNVANSIFKLSVILFDTNHRGTEDAEVERKEINIERNLP